MMRNEALAAHPAQRRLKTRAASGLKDFDALLDESALPAPRSTVVETLDVGHLTGCTMYVDGGLQIVRPLLARSPLRLVEP